MLDEHLKAREIQGHAADVDQIRRRAQHWRLVDCSGETLEQMRHALIEEMERLEARLEEADRRFMLFVEKGRPLDTEEARETIDRLTDEWRKLNRHLKEVDEALLERHLRNNLIKRLGSQFRLNILDGAVFLAIILVVGMTLAEFFFPLPDETVRLIVTVDTVICFFLIADFLLRLGLSEDKGWYWRRYWIDLLSSIPFYEVLRFGRLVRIMRFARLFRLLRLGRALRLLTFSFRGLEKLLETFKLNLLKRSLVIAVVLLLVGALSIRALEGGQEPSLLALGESVWWSFTTIVTGGFADLYNPDTASGRFLTVGLVLLGLTVTGIFTASLTSVLVEDDSHRLEQNQHSLETQLETLEQKLDLLSEETNEGLIALETVAQALSNQTSREGVAAVLADTMMADFQCVQASVHLLEEGETLVRLVQRGRMAGAPPERMGLEDGLPGRVVTNLLDHPHLDKLDLEPETELNFNLQGMSMVCPLVAAQRVLGVLHVVLPDTLARVYLYNRVPMTLAHHAAMAFHAADLNGRQDGAGA